MADREDIPNGIKRCYTHMTGLQVESKQRISDRSRPGHVGSMRQGLFKKVEANPRPLHSSRSVSYSICPLVRNHNVTDKTSLTNILNSTKQ